MNALFIHLIAPHLNICACRPHRHIIPKRI